MSETPETDALYKRLLAENPGNFIHLEEFLELACRLEREMDEALTAIHNYKCEVEAWELLRGARRERDEARAERDSLKLAAQREAEHHDRMVGELEKVYKERDEAREQIKELIYIAERGIALAEIDFENDKFGVVSELRDGVERLKEGAK
ncbi:MAG: hypothetical protein EBY32_10635 [Proteobacteria bacterium]|nr:hypothetical protein [Pseudomonadota bacterium]